MFFKIEKLAERIIQIKDIADTAMYLVNGDEKSLLIDTGVGVGSLKEIVESLTDKPVIVVLTHGHVDHAMGSNEFEQVYMSELDQKVYEKHSTLSARKDCVRSSMAYGGDKTLLESIKDSDYLEPKKISEFLPLNVGDDFDLGGIHALILEGKGHTPGTVTILLPELRTLLLGDACNSFTYLFDYNSSTVEEYMELLKILKLKTDGKYDRVLLCHGSGEGNVNLIESAIEVCQDIMEGCVDDIPFEQSLAVFENQPAFIAKAMDFVNFCRSDGKSANIVYRKDRVFNSI